MKILFILPTHGFGGCEFNALTVASIVQQRYNVDVYVAYPYVNETEYLGYLCELNNLRTVNLECLFLNRDDIGLVSVQRTATKRLLDNIDPDLVFAAFPWPKRGQGVILALSDVCTPALIKFALVPPSWDKSYIASGVAEQLGKRQMWFANSRYSAELLERHLGLPAKSVDGFHVGPIGLKYLLSQTDDEPQDSVADVRRELDIPPDALMITTVARLSEQKGHAQLFPAIERMAQERPDAVFVWVGDGELRGTLQTEAARKGLADKIRFAGFRTDVRRVLRASDIFALPTLFEGGCSQALLEAMEEGLPCVVTDTSATGEIIQSGKNGLLASPSKADAFSNALSQLARSPSERERLGEAAKVFSAAFSAEEMFQQTIKRLEQVARRKLPPKAGGAHMDSQPQLTGANYIDVSIDGPQFRTGWFQSEHPKQWSPHRWMGQYSNLRSPLPDGDVIKLFIGGATCSDARFVEDLTLYVDGVEVPLVKTFTNPAQKAWKASASINARDKSRRGDVLIQLVTSGIAEVPGWSPAGAIVQTAKASVSIRRLILESDKRV